MEYCVTIVCLCAAFCVYVYYDYKRYHDIEEEEHQKDIEFNNQVMRMLDEIQDILKQGKGN